MMLDALSVIYVQDTLILQTNNFRCFSIDGKKQITSVLEISLAFTKTAEIRARSLADFHCQLADRHMKL